ncbi:hypothetical protein GcM3_193008 [Golovinomyces cichoracearum]|uniref:Uncharacterized protein n=1 Tax=Golovinomyces cichoracearum TaxID=62708 RepID=A0A420HGW4_9PEZI|nr:hypothetical protein GcM3_193008 [Golovinomyces cichoracearum]
MIIDFTPGKFVDVLILGAGWTSKFILPCLEGKNITYAATSTTGRDNTLEFKFKYDADTATNNTASNTDLEQYTRLPYAKTVVITFPIIKPGASLYLIKTYLETHPGINASSSLPQVLWIQLGSSSIYRTIAGQELWIDRNSRFDYKSSRANSEEELLSAGGCVLNLAGLWGLDRQPVNWIEKVAPTKEDLARKGSLHLIHGEDVARAITAVHLKPQSATGQRYIITDLIVYDWWEIVLSSRSKLSSANENWERFETYIQWVGELMEEFKVKALPRPNEQLGHCYDTRDFWNTFGIMPRHAGI